jgi:S1-C subfamily serine protease
MPSIDNFIGFIAVGEKRLIDASNFAFDVKKILGNGFVVKPEIGIILTCEHVLPLEDRESGGQFAFFVYDENMNLRVFMIDVNSAIQWDKNDVLALKLFNPNGLKTLQINVNDIQMAVQVITIGMPLNHFSSKINENIVTARALVSNVVSCYESECEIDKPFIITMSGSPVLIGKSIVGIATTNREYAINQYRTEKVEQNVEGGQITKEVYQYEEVARFGVFSKASSWINWLNTMTV